MTNLDSHLEAVHATREKFGATISAPSIAVPASFCVAPQVSTPPPTRVMTPPSQLSPDIPEVPMSSPESKADADVPMASPAGTDITMGTPSSIGAAVASNTAGALAPVPPWPEPESSQVQSAGAAPKASEDKNLVCAECGKTDLQPRIECIFCAKSVHKPPFQCSDGSACTTCLNTREELGPVDSSSGRRGGRGRGSGSGRGSSSQGTYIISCCVLYCISFNIPNPSNPIQSDSINVNPFESIACFMNLAPPTTHFRQGQCGQC